MHHVALDRPRSNKSDFDDQIVEAFRLEARQHGHLGARFDLEDADGIGVADHFINGRVFARNILHAEGATDP